MNVEEQGIPAAMLKTSSKTHGQPPSQSSPNLPWDPQLQSQEHPLHWGARPLA